MHARMGIPDVAPGRAVARMMFLSFLHFFQSSASAFSFVCSLLGHRSLSRPFDRLGVVHSMAPVVACPNDGNGG